MAATEEDFEDGWQVASRGIQLALNNRVDEAQKLLKSAAAAANAAGYNDGGVAALQAQAGFCFLAFMVRATWKYFIRE